MTYCTARVDATETPSGHADQDVYLKTLVATGSVDHIEFGYYVARVKSAPLAVREPNGRPRLIAPQWPVMIQDGTGTAVCDARKIDAALVVSNDSDLRFPIEQASVGVGRHFWRKLKAIVRSVDHPAPCGPGLFFHWARTFHWDRWASIDWLASQPSGNLTGTFK